MGDTKRRRKLFTRPRRLYDSVRIEAENVLVERYGLKNKREIWKAKSHVSKLRGRAKDLIGSNVEEQQAFFNKLNSKGYDVLSISDVLALTEENLLKRRLQTFVHKLGLSASPREARQFIIHKNILVDGCVVNIPSFVVTRELEGKITLKKPIKRSEVTSDE